ncbi:hypothetical protein OG500_06710 [Kitasatospora sp. NBC_01250]|uniref:hypothetical protein n=1 Tax=unclassified Kitasatospora TaxID=2633591 RepID=UPI002E12296C|nr:MULTISPECIES: hypothetical protein [unclassified Kitasatospora]WSJ65801.1 hypothetical protein OG294_06580 [Kitasatospora sp. NBC_01302]
MAQPVTNHQLEAAITDAEMTFDALARGVVRVAAEVGVHLRTNPSTVHKWLRGSDPEGDTPAFICEALFRRTGRPYTPAELGLRSVEQSDPGLGLSIGPDPVGVLARVWRADLDRRKFLAASAYSVAAIHLPLEYVRESAERTAAVRSGSVAGAAEVVAVRDMISMFTEIDERHGGQHGRSALIQYLRSDVAALCRGSFRTHEDRQQMLSAAAVGVHLAGWKAYDAGEQGLAQRYYHQSYALAVESGIVGHDAFVLRTLAQQGMKLRHPSKTFALSDTALTWAAGRVDAGTEALFTITHAHGLAATNQRRPAVLAVQRARDLLETADLDDMPYWARSWGPARATVNSRSAKVFARLGDRKGAAENYAAAAATRPATTYARIKALDLVAQAKMELADGGIEQACGTWNRALDSMEGVQSVRTRRAVLEMRKNLAQFKSRGVSAAQELDERASIFLA